METSLDLKSTTQEFNDDFSIVQNGSQIVITVFPHPGSKLNNVFLFAFWVCGLCFMCVIAYQMGKEFPPFLVLTFLAPLAYACIFFFAFFVQFEKQILTLNPSVICVEKTIFAWRRKIQIPREDISIAMVRLALPQTSLALMVYRGDVSPRRWLFKKGSAYIMPHGLLVCKSRQIFFAEVCQPKAVQALIEIINTYYGLNSAPPP